MLLLINEPVKLNWSSPVIQSISRLKCNSFVGQTSERERERVRNRMVSHLAHLVFFFRVGNILFSLDKLDHLNKYTHFQARVWLKDHSFAYRGRWFGAWKENQILVVQFHLQVDWPIYIMPEWSHLVSSFLDRKLTGQCEVTCSQKLINFFLLLRLLLTLKWDRISIGNPFSTIPAPPIRGRIKGPSYNKLKGAQIICPSSRSSGHLTFAASGLLLILIQPQEY